MTHARTLIAALQHRVLTTLGPLIEGRRHIAMLEFPNYPNVGDSAIYLGQLAALEALGRRSRFVSDLGTYSARELARWVTSDDVILLTGGGSFGDLWPTAQTMREDILRSFPHVRIVQLPQTMYFASEDALQRARAAVGAHPDVTLLVRDERSLDLARRAFDAPAQLCPDMAFALGALRRQGRPSRDVQWLLRTDQESAVPRERRVTSDDWTDEPPSVLRSLSYALMGAVRRPRVQSLARRLLMQLYPALARQRLARGRRVLEQGRVVVTDRLHAHILSLLSGIPHVVLDNSYGKLSSHFTTWMRDVDGVAWASSGDEAAELATALASQPAAVDA